MSVFASLSRSSGAFSITKYRNFMISNLTCEKPTEQCFNAVCNKCTVNNLFDKLLPQLK